MRTCCYTVNIDTMKEGFKIHGYNFVAQGSSSCDVPVLSGRDVSPGSESSHTVF